MQNYDCSTVITNKCQQDLLFVKSHDDLLRLRGGSDIFKDNTNAQLLKTQQRDPDSETVELNSFDQVTVANDNLMSIQNAEQKSDSLVSISNSDSMNVAKQLERLNVVRECLYSKYGWGSNNVDQTSKWDVDMATNDSILTADKFSETELTNAGTKPWENFLPMARAKQGDDKIFTDTWNDSAIDLLNEPQQQPPPMQPPPMQAPEQPPSAAGHVQPLPPQLSRNQVFPPDDLVCGNLASGFQSDSITTPTTPQGPFPLQQPSYGGPQPSQPNQNFFEPPRYSPMQSQNARPALTFDFQPKELPPQQPPPPSLQQHQMPKEYHLFDDRQDHHHQLFKINPLPSQQSQQYSQGSRAPRAITKKGAGIPSPTGDLFASNIIPNPSTPNLYPPQKNLPEQDNAFMLRFQNLNLRNNSNMDSLASLPQQRNQQQQPNIFNHHQQPPQQHPPLSMANRQDMMQSYFQKEPDHKFMPQQTQQFNMPSNNIQMPNVADTASQIKSLWPPNPPQNKSVWSLPSTGVDFGFQNENIFPHNQRNNINNMNNGGSNNVNNINGMGNLNNLGNLGNLGNMSGNMNNMGGNMGNLGNISTLNSLGNLNNLNNFSYEFAPLFPQESEPPMRAMSSAFRRNESHNIDMQFYPPKF